ncbi:MAG: prepilin-type N-terminal cleavage/methylation domain-containing protein [Gemmatimonadaceae bacterium]
MRRAVTLVELLVTLVVFGLVLGLITHTLLFHQRLQRRLQAANAASRAAGQATTILAATLADVARSDLVTNWSSDSAVEVMAPVGVGVACVAGNELRTAASATEGEPPLVVFTATPEPGDRLMVFDDRPRPPLWRARTVVEVAPAVQPCAPTGLRAAPGFTLRLDSALDASPIVAFRLLRRTRYDLYRSGDRLWYLGMREWNAQARAFNGVQPVAGPLQAYSMRAERTGLSFEYFDSVGGRLGVPLDSAVVSRVTITARPADTTVGATRRSVAMRRAP